MTQLYFTVKKDHHFFHLLCCSHIRNGSNILLRKISSSCLVEKNYKSEQNVLDKLNEDCENQLNCLERISWDSLDRLLELCNDCRFNTLKLQKAILSLSFLFKIKCAYAKLEDLFYEYFSAIRKDDENLVSQNIFGGECCSWYRCYLHHKIEPLVELRKIKALYEKFKLKNDEWATFKVKKLKLADWCQPQESVFYL